MNFFKPNASNTGHCVGFSFNPKDGALYAQFVKQSGPKSFKNGAKFNVKFSATEIGAILNTIERDKEAKLFHQTEKGATSIQLDSYPKPKPETPDAPKKPNDGFTISVLPRAIDGGTTDKFGFWFNSSEERLLKEYLQFVLVCFFTFDAATDKKRRDEAALNKKGPQAQDAAQESAPVGNDEF